MCHIVLIALTYCKANVLKIDCMIILKLTNRYLNNALNDINHCHIDLNVVISLISFRIGVNFENRGTIVVLERYGLALCFLEVF